MNKQVEYNTLATMKSVLRMNEMGLKHSAQRGKAIRPMYAEFLGLKKTDSYAVYIAEVQRRMDKILESILPQLGGEETVLERGVPG